MFNRDVYFEKVRESLFGGHLDQGQVDGQNAILTVWEKFSKPEDDLRYLAYMLATAKHETASTMLPIEEYGKGGDAEYAQIDPETHQGYWGRGFVQLTWRDNYARADKELQLTEAQSCEWHADNALHPFIAAAVMFKGMNQGWFRSGETLGKYFNEDTDDAFEAREIINGDKHYTPDWANGETIGNIIKGYHEDFLAALEGSIEFPEPAPDPSTLVDVLIYAPPGVKINVQVLHDIPPSYPES
jgi:hypothetical protein